MRHTAASVLVAFVGFAVPALAQSADPGSSRFEAGIGVLWVGTQPLGDRFATETIASGDAQPLFHLTSDLSGAAGVAARVGVRVTRALVVEAEGSYLRPELRVDLRADSEGATPVTAVESIQQYMIGGDVLWFPPPLRRPRMELFVLGGGGYLRQLHEAATLVETGRYYDVGGGVSWLLATGRHFHTKGAGLRVDARAVVRSRGVAFDGGSKTSPAVGASLFVRF